MHDTVIAHASRAYACAAERVYDAWLDPAIARRFFFATPPNGEVVRCEIEPGIGGRFTIVDRRPDPDGGGMVDAEHVGRFLQLDRPRRIAFAFSVPQYSSQETSVVIDITPQGDGCALQLRHELGNGIQAEEHRAKAEHGWATMLAHLEQALKA